MKRLALGAAMGTPAARINSSARGWAGMRRPTVGNPAVTMSGIQRPLGDDQRQRVRASNGAPGYRRPWTTRRPGRSPSRWNRHGRSAGLVRGRPLAAKMRATASGSSALAPRPYTVSVGKATRRPARINAAARSISGVIPGSRLYRLRRFFRSCATRDRRGSARRDRLPGRGPRRRWRGGCAGLSPGGKERARSCGSGCRS